MPDDTTERWLPVVGWEGVYEVSDLGTPQARGGPQDDALGRGSDRQRHVPPPGLRVGAPDPPGRAPDDLRPPTGDDRLRGAVPCGPLRQPHQRGQDRQPAGEPRVPDAERPDAARRPHRAGRPHHRGAAPNCLWPDGDVASWRLRYEAGETAGAIAESVGGSRTMAYDAVNGPAPRWPSGATRPHAPAGRGGQPTRRLGTRTPPCACGGASTPRACAARSSPVRTRRPRRPCGRWWRAEAAPCGVT